MIMEFYILGVMAKGYATIVSLYDIKSGDKVNSWFMIIYIVDKTRCQTNRISKVFCYDHKRGS